MSETTDRHVCAYHYGLLHPLDWGEDCEDALRKQTALWNQLVEIERAHVEKVRAVAAADTTVATTETMRAAAVERLKALTEERKSRNKAARRRLDAGTDETTAAARQELREATLAAREARKAAYAASRDGLRELETARIQAVTKARQIANADGLWWCNANAVIESYETARRRSSKSGAELHFRRHDGSGRFTNQIQGGMTVDELLGAAHSQVQIGPRPEHLRDRGGRMARKGRRVLSLTATIYTRERGAERRTVAWPLILDRPLPPGCRIQQVSIHRRKRGQQFVWSVSFTVRTTAPAARMNGSIVAVNLGWRMTNSGLRVATVVRQGAEDDPEHIVMPAHLIDAIERCERHRSAADQSLLDMSGMLSGLPLDEAPDSLREQVAYMRSAPRLRLRNYVILRRIWQTDAPTWHSTELRELGDYVHRQQSDAYTDAHRRAWINDARRKHYEGEVLRLLGDARLVIINQHDMSKTARVEDTALPPAARYHRVVAAPSVARLVIDNLTRRLGIARIAYSGAHDRCAQCDATLAVRDPAALWWSCHRCGHSFDQDAGFCRLMLRERSGDADQAGVARDNDNTEKSITRGRANRRSGGIR